MYKIKEVAIEAAKEAGKILVDGFKNSGYRLKKERDYVTDADMASEKKIIEIIKKNFPDHSILGEENGLEDNKSEYLWIIDPLCSTNNFVFGLPLFGLAIALTFKKKTIFGLIYLPLLDKMVWAEKDKGAFLNDKKMGVSIRNKLSGAIVLYDNQFQKSEIMLPNFNLLVKPTFTLRILGSAAADLCFISEGLADARIFNNTKVCDFAAGALIIEEAGGRVTNFKGEPWSLEDKKIIASNGLIHDELLNIIKDSGGD